jgi:hypothetical protein
MVMKNIQSIAPAWDKKALSALAAHLHASTARGSTWDRLDKWLTQNYEDDGSDLRCTGIVLGAPASEPEKRVQVRQHVLLHVLTGGSNRRYRYLTIITTTLSQPSGTTTRTQTTHG